MLHLRCRFLVCLFGFFSGIKKWKVVKTTNGSFWFLLFEVGVELEIFNDELSSICRIDFLTGFLPWFLPRLAIQWLRHRTGRKDHGGWKCFFLFRIGLGLILNLLCENLITISDWSFGSSMNHKLAPIIWTWIYLSYAFLCVFFLVLSLLFCKTSQIFR